MPNLRVIYDNAANRATLTASSTAGALGVSNLKVPLKSVVWRSAQAAAGATPTATLTADWTSPEIVGGVALPFCNLTSQATVRVRGYVLPGDAVPLFDTGDVAACPGVPLGSWAWGMLPLGVNAYAYGGGALARAWIPVPGSVRRLVVDIADPGNPGGYVETAYLVCGTYWEPEHNGDYGISMQAVDNSKNFRNDAGDLMSDQGSRSDKLQMPMSKIAPADRTTLWGILRGSGITRPVFISVFPEHSDVALEQQFQLYGKLVTTPAMSLPSFNIASATLEVESV